MRKHNDNAEMPKPKENQLGILKIYGFCQKIQQSASGTGESIAGFCYLSMRMHQKNCHIFSLRVLSWIVLSNSTMRKGTPMQIKNNQDMGELQQPRNKSGPPFRQTMINS